MKSKGNSAKILIFCLVTVCACLFTIFVFACIGYPGKHYIYILFTLACNTLLYFGFRKNALFFDTFIGVFLWLGFWMKLTFRVAFMGGYFSQAVGNFDGSGNDFDMALLVSSCGILGLLAVSYLREKFIFTYSGESNTHHQDGWTQFYIKNRKWLLPGFGVLFITVALTNSFFGIYQKGVIPKTILPFGIGGIYKWLLLFGLASFSAMILKAELTFNRKTSYTVVILSLLESFFSNVSLLSRGMILNVGGLVYGVIKSWMAKAIKPDYKLLIVSFFAFIVLFVGSIVLVNHMRYMLIVEGRLDLNFKKIYENMDNSYYITSTSTLFFLDRWVGIEGVMAMTSFPGQGWELLKNAWNEKFSYNQLSFYDENLIISPYQGVDKKKHHYISLPGIIAFCFYPGSYLFLFGCMFAVGAVGAAIEISVFKIGGKNLILCALLSQVVAYRFAHFGYVPKQSYLLFGALYLNLFLIYFFNKFLFTWYHRKNEKLRTRLSEEDKQYNKNIIMAE